MRIVNFANFQNLIYMKLYMKLYSLIILNKIQKRKKNNVKAPEKTQLALFDHLIRYN